MVIVNSAVDKRSRLITEVEEKLKIAAFVPKRYQMPYMSS